MSAPAVLAEPAAVPPPPQAAGAGSLLRAELRRFRSRRLVRVLLLLGIAAFVTAVAVASTQFSSPSAATTAKAEQRRAEVLQQQRSFREQCLTESQAARPPGVSAEDFCGPELTAEDLGDVSSFVDEQPFSLAREGRDGVVGVAVVAGGLAFLLGATYVGAEWSTRSMVALLFWEPRRVRVMGVKLAVLAAAAAVLGVVAQAAWLVAAKVLAATRGVPDERLPRGLTGQLLSSAGRGVLLVVLLGLLGFGVANLLRNTAAASGFAFVYFVVVENVLRAARPALQPYLLAEAAGALVQRGGTRIYLDEGFVDDKGFYSSTGREVVVSNLHGGLLLGGVVAVVVALGVALFARRDLD